MDNETIEVERISDLTEGQYSADSWLVIDTGTVVVKLKLKDAVPDASTEVKGKVQLSDSTNNDSSHVAATSKAVKSVMDALTQAAESLSDVISGKYSKPSSGIPKSDLSSAVQTSLENGDNAVAALAEIGKPLVWHGDADVATLNGTIEGLQNGWTFTLTDSGTLTAGSVLVEVGDEVAWTGSAWFKVGGEGGVKILHGSANPGGTTYPDAEDVVNAVAQNKDVIILWNQQGNLFIYRLVYVYGYGSSGDKTYFFRCLQDQNEVKKLSVSDGVGTWSRSTTNSIALPAGIASLYSDSSTYSVGDAVMYGGLRYVCNTAITVPEEWNPAHWTLQSVQAMIESLGSDVEIVNVADYAPNTSDLFDYLSALYSAGKTAILRYSYAMYNSDYVVGYNLGWSPYGSLYQIKAFSNVYAGTVNILTIDSSGYSFVQQYVGRLTELTDATESDLDNNAISMGDNVVQKLTLTTISTLTVNIGSAGNFALEIDNTGNSNDVTVSVVRSGTTTLKYSVAGGNTVGAGKYMQLTCVGSCWTLAEFTVPSP